MFNIPAELETIIKSYWGLPSIAEQHKRRLTPILAGVTATRVYHLRRRMLEEWYSKGNRDTRRGSHEDIRYPNEDYEKPITFKQCHDIYTGRTRFGESDFGYHSYSACSKLNRIARVYRYEITYPDVMPDPRREGHDYHYERR